MRVNDANGTDVIDFSPQKPDKGIYRVDLDVAAFSPNCFDNRGPGYNAALISDKKFQKPEFCERKTNFFAFAKCPIRGGIEDEIAVFEHVSGSWGSATAKRPNARQELLKRKGLCKVVVGSSVQPFHNIWNCVFCGEHENANILLSAANLARDIQAAQPGKHYVQQNHVELRVTGKLKRGRPVIGYIDVVIFLAKALRQKLRHMRIVFND
jgi:hypothetical protein